MTPAQLEHRLSQNAASPIFARLADEYLAQGKISEARALCISGLENFTSYPTPYLVLAKCLEAEENFSAAREVIGLARKILPSLTLFHDLEVEYTAKLSPEEAALLSDETIPADVDVGEGPVAEADDGGVGMSAFFENREPHREDEQEIARSAPELTVSDPEPVEDKTGTEVAASPEIVSKKLTDEEEKAVEIPAAPAATPHLPPLRIEHRPLSPTPDGEDNGELMESASFEAGGRIVSRTLAEIYAIQGAYAEAILTFNLLMQEKPEFRKDCEARIRDLEAKMQSKPLS